MKVVKLDRLLLFIKGTDELGTTQKEILEEKAKKLAENFFTMPPEGPSEAFTFEDVQRIMGISPGQEHSLSPRERELLQAVLDALPQSRIEDFFFELPMESAIEGILRAIQELLQERISRLPCNSEGKIVITPAKLERSIASILPHQLSGIERFVFKTRWRR